MHQTSKADPGEPGNRAKPVPGGVPTRAGSDFGRRWPWLFPATYLVHIADEYWAGVGFPAWVQQVAGFTIAPRGFLLANAVFWVLMTAIVIVALVRRSQRWLLVVLGTIVIINGSIHLGGTFATGTYSPGAASAALLWIPLGVVTLHRARRALGRSLWARGIATGAVLHLLVPVIGFGIGSLVGY